jgi:hypothetical protein
MAAPLYRIRRGGSWHYNERPADPGLLLTLDGAANDEKLLRLGYLEEVRDPQKLEKYPRCGECGHYFLTDRDRAAHGDRRHAPQRERIRTGAPPALAGVVDTQSATGVPEGYIVEDLTGDDEERRMEREAPLYLDQTAASRR